MPALNHIHAYQKVNGKPNLYRCKHPDCNHFMDKKLLLGKRSMCICGKDFILGHYELRLKNPHCKECTNTGGGPNKGKKPVNVKPTEMIGILEKVL